MSSFKIWLYYANFSSKLLPLNWFITKKEIERNNANKCFKIMSNCKGIENNVGIFYYTESHPFVGDNRFRHSKIKQFVVQIQSKGNFKRQQLQKINHSITFQRWWWRSHSYCVTLLCKLRIDIASIAWEVISCEVALYMLRSTFFWSSL